MVLATPLLGKIIPGGSLGGKCRQSELSGGQSPLAGASVSADQSPYGSYGDFLVVHGKEKVCGSIP